MTSESNFSVSISFPYVDLDNSRLVELLDFSLTCFPGNHGVLLFSTGILYTVGVFTEGKLGEYG